MGDICAVLVAAGSGLRFSSGSKPKQFLELKKRPIYLWALERFVQHIHINRIVICTLDYMVQEVNDLVADLFPEKQIDVISGGQTRQQSVRLGLLKLAQLESIDPEFVLIHDAVRPFLTSKIIDQAIDCVKRHGACTAAIPVTDTIKKVQDQFIVETLDRSALMSIQTPQAAKYDWLMKAHDQALKKGLATTDDAALLEAAGYSVAVFLGSSTNIKVTQKEDMAIAEQLANLICV